MALSKVTWDELGASPTTLYGPQAAAGVTSNGSPQPQFKPGTMVTGDGGEWVFCTLVLAGTTTLANGQAYVIDRNWVATLITTANSPRGVSVGFGNVSQASVAAGTYYIFLQISGHVGVQFTGVANALAETTATGGLLNFTNTPTGTTKAVVPIALMVASQTFTADNTLNSFTLTNVSSLNDVSVGASLAGTGVGASAKVVAYGTNSNNFLGNWIQVDVVSTATNTAQTITQTGVITANVMRPVVGVTN